MPNPKTYPWWPELVKKLDHSIIQIGVEGEQQLVPDCRFNLSLKQLKVLVSLCDVWLTVDSFLPHLAHIVGKPGVVIWSVSDPTIFGYPENINLLKDRKYLRPNQFEYWEAQSFVEEAFVSPDVVVDAVNLIMERS